MGMVTAGTYDTTDTESKPACRCFKGSCVVSVYGKTSGMTTGAGKSVKLQAVNKIIIKIWC